MSGTPRTTLKPGDMLFWAADPEDEHREGTPVFVEENGLRIVYAPTLWHDAQGVEQGPTTREAELILRGEEEFRLPGHLFKCYDSATGKSFADPALEAE